MNSQVPTYSRFGVYLDHRASLNWRTGDGFIITVEFSEVHKGLCRSFRGTRVTR